MREFIDAILKPGTFGRWFISGFYRNPIRFTGSFFRSVIATKQLTGRFYPIRVRIGVGQDLLVHVGNKSTITLIGNLLVNSWGGTNVASSISCSNESNFSILGDFEIGPNVHIELAQGAKLKLGGKRNSSASGITCDSRIMVEDSLDIGSDCIIAWDVYISDSDWHDISGVARSSPVLIGDHVWISHGVSILKGSVIPSGCIVGAKSLVTSVFETEKVLIGGIPAKVLRNGVEWSR